MDVDATLHASRVKPAGEDVGVTLWKSTVLEYIGGYMGIMEKKMDTTILYRVYIGCILLVLATSKTHGYTALLFVAVAE